MKDAKYIRCFGKWRKHHEWERKYTVNLAYNVPVGTSVFCPLYTKYTYVSYFVCYRHKPYFVRTLFDIHVNVTLSDVQLHAYIMFHLGYYVFKSFIVTCILHCECFKSSINTNKVVIEIFYSNMLKLQCLSTWILVACESQAHIFKSRFQIPHVQLEMKS